MGASIISLSFLLFFNRIMTDMVISTSLITYSIYSLNRITDMEEDASNIPERVAFLENKKNVILSLSILSYIVALIMGAMENLWTMPIFLTPFIVGIIYSIKIASFRIKDIFGMKNISIAFSWAFSSAFLPYVFLPNVEEGFMVFFFLFIKCFVNTVVFDTRDMEGDKKAGARTIPVVLGVRKTMLILLIANSLLIPWIIFCYIHNFFVPYIPVIAFSIIYGYWYIIAFCRGKDRESKYNYDYLVDGEFIILFLFAFIIHIMIN